MAEIGVLHLAFAVLQWSVSAAIGLARVLLRLVLGVLEIVAWSIGAIDNQQSPTSRPSPNASARWRVHAAWRS